MLKKFISLAAVAASIFGCSGSGSSDGPSGPGAATLEDLPNCTENREGEEFTLADNGFVYRCEDGAWEFVSAPLDTASTLDDLPNCTGKIDGDSVLVKGENAVFQCTGGKWKKVRSLGMTVATADDLVSCTSRRDGDSAYVADVHSIYSCTDGKWNKVATLMDTVKTADDMPGCSDKYDGDSTYVQSDSSVYICMQKKWRLLGESVSTEDNMKNCTESREDMRIFVVDIRKSLICRDGKWYSFKLADLIEDEETEAPAESSSSGNKWEELPSSSSVKSSSSSAGSSSSVASSSSVKSSSSVASSSSVVESSSSVNQSSSGVESSSSALSSSSVKSSSSESSSSNVVTSGDDDVWSGGTYIVDDRDGEIYRIVSIGDQTWMAENLRFKGHGHGDSYCYQDENENCEKYGRLYTWIAVMDGYEEEKTQGICPDEWHVPSSDEWKTLYSYVRGQMRIVQDFAWSDGVDGYGFSVKIAGQYQYAKTSSYPAGFSNGWDASHERGYTAAFWTSTDYSSAMARQWYFYESFNGGDSEWSSSNAAKENAYSVRCVRNTFIPVNNPVPKKLSVMKTPYDAVQIGRLTWKTQNVDGLYDWAEAMGIASQYNSSGAVGVVNAKQQGVCPSGFHIPHNSEWYYLKNYVNATNGSESVGASLMEENSWPAINGATNSYGFSALPIGSETSGFDDDLLMENATYFWSATEDYEDRHAHYFSLISGPYNNDLYQHHNNYNKKLRFSVRCVQD